jgi:hypothetical protein
MNQKRHRNYGWTIDEWIAATPGDLNRDATGLWHIVCAGREGFGLSGQELIDFVRRSLLALFEKGAKPVTGATDDIHIWRPLTNYQGDADQIAQTIIDEWQASGRDPDAGGMWFALPHIYEQKWTRNNSTKQT